MKLNGRVVYPLDLNKVLKMGEPRHDISQEILVQALDIIIEDTQKIKALFDRNNREMPSEIKIIYDLETQRVNAGYRYGKIVNENIAWDELFDQWYMEQKRLEESKS